MRRVAHYVFNAAALLSLVVLVFLSWLTWDLGREIRVGGLGVWGYRPNVTFIFGSLKETPNLKLALSEGGAGWLPWALERLDYTWARSRYEGVQQHEKPPA